MKNNIRKIFMFLARRKFFNWMPDRIYLKLRFWASTGEKLNLNNPVTFNEKLQWLKLYYRDYNYVKMVDKVTAKEFAASVIGDDSIIPTLGVYNSFEDINFQEFPEQFVLKCSHDSGSVVICESKQTFDKKVACKKLTKAQHNNFWKFGREWPYKYVKPRIIAETFLVSEGGIPKDFKLFCFDGVCKLIQVDTNRFANHTRNLYTPEWDFVNASMSVPNNPDDIIIKPSNLDTMLAYAEKLSSGIPFVRVDFYDVNDRIYFGEMTFFHGSGMLKFKPESLNKKMGDWIVLPKKMCDCF